jgi:hypothetical protein
MIKEMPFVIERIHFTRYAEYDTMGKQSSTNGNRAYSLEKGINILHTISKPHIMESGRTEGIRYYAILCILCPIV